MSFDKKNELTSRLEKVLQIIKTKNGKPFTFKNAIKRTSAEINRMGNSRK